VILGGATLIGESAMWAACSTRERPRVATTGAFSPGDIAFLDEVAETILPETQTPGAKAAGVGPFMALMVTDCYEPADQQIFRDGMRAVDEVCRKANGTSFMSASSDQRLAVLQGLDRDQKAYSDAKKPDDPNHYFRMMKELALLGYFTSEIGCTRAQRYVESPGRYDPCTPYVPGTPAWAAHG
jgi:hypothetical protein